MRPLRFVSALFAVSLFFSCEPDVVPKQGNKPIELTHVMLGYITKNDQFSEVTGTENSYYATFNSQEDIDKAVEAGYGDKITNSKYQYPDNEDEDIIWIVRAQPETAQIREYKIESSDPEVLEIVKVDLAGVHVKVKKLGAVTLTVFVSGAKNTLVADFPIDIIGYCNLKFYVRDLQLTWNGVMGGGSSSHELDKMTTEERVAWFEKMITLCFRNVAIKNKIKGVPPGIDDVFMEIRDSLSITDYAAPLKFDENGNLRIDTQRHLYTFRRNRRFYRHMRNRRLTLRDITDIVQHVYNTTVPGVAVEDRKVKDPRTGEEVTIRDTVVYDYRFIIDHIRVDYWVYCDNPYIYFDTEVDTYGDVYTYDDMSDVGPDDDSDVANLKPSKSKYFEVFLNDFMTKEERDSLANELRKKKKEAGYLDVYSDAQKDSVVRKMNENLDDPISVDWESEEI